MLNAKQLRALRRAPLDGANKLRLAIELAKTTQTKVAEKVGIPQSQVSEDVAGRYSALTLTKARAYADYFWCEVDDLFPRSKEKAA